MAEVRRLRLPVPSDRALRWMMWIVAIALALATVGAVAAIASFAQRLDNYQFALDRADEQRAAIEATNDAQADAILDQQRALREANERCREAADCTPVPTPPVVVSGDPGAPGAPGATGATGATGARGPGPSAAQVAVAVASYCAAGACSGPGPTTNQVAAAVVTYCDRNGQCRGPAGADGQSITGAKGSDGRDGAPGERGPGPTAEQVAAAVAEYCADGRCVGPTGSTGATGQTGAPGRGISSVSCDSVTPMSLTVTYSDGAVETYTCGAPSSTD